MAIEYIVGADGKQRALLDNIESTNDIEEVLQEIHTSLLDSDVENKDEIIELLDKLIEMC